MWQVNYPHYAIFFFHVFMGSFGFQVLKPKYQTYVDTYQIIYFTGSHKFQDHQLRNKIRKAKKLLYLDLYRKNWTVDTIALLEKNGGAHVA